MKSFLKLFKLNFNTEVKATVQNIFFSNVGPFYYIAAVLTVLYIKYLTISFECTLNITPPKTKCHFFFFNFDFRRRKRFQRRRRKEVST